MSKQAKTPHKQKFIAFLERLDSELCALGASELIQKQTYLLAHLAQHKESERLTDSFFSEVVTSSKSIINLVLVVQEEIQKMKY